MGHKTDVGFLIGVGRQNNQTFKYTKQDNYYFDSKIESTIFSTWCQLG